MTHPMTILKYAFVASFLLTGCNMSSTPLPVDVSVRPANPLSGAYNVARFKNMSKATLSVVLTFRNPTFGQRKTFNMVLTPDETREIGWLEGWDVVPGETVTLQSNGYADKSIRF